MSKASNSKTSLVQNLTKGALSKLSQSSNSTKRKLGKRKAKTSLKVNQEEKTPSHENTSGQDGTGDESVSVTRSTFSGTNTIKRNHRVPADD